MSRTAIHPASSTDAVAVHNTSRGFDDLSPSERDKYVHEIELCFRKFIAESRSRTGFVMYPSSRRIMQTVTDLYQLLAGIDFSEVAL
ncbi:hypothetical protein GGF46_003824 [Coemansia sp. RSA 552]|nr:hypothetical protein GGF46_003824 [Coemansia sp. RSA 552]